MGQDGVDGFLKVLIMRGITVEGDLHFLERSLTAAQYKPQHGDPNRQKRRQREQHTVGACTGHQTALMLGKALHQAAYITEAPPPGKARFRCNRPTIPEREERL